MDITEEALQVVLYLLDNIYDLRQHMLALSEAIADISTVHFQRDLLTQSAKRAPRRLQQDSVAEAQPHLSASDT